jgi:peroxiredoxin
MPINVGDDAPDFELMNQDKTPVKLSSFRGHKKVVLLFYPMDFSPVCTAEHCTFGPQLDQINAGGDAVVFGVSTDSPFCHAAFKKQYNIPYDLLADVNRKVSKAYNLFMGEEPFNCSKRGTVLIDKHGKVAYWHEQPTKEARKVEDLSKAVAIETAMAQRANEGGDAVT